MISACTSMHTRYTETRRSVATFLEAFISMNNWLPPRTLGSWRCKNMHIIFSQTTNTKSISFNNILIQHEKIVVIIHRHPNKTSTEHKRINSVYIVWSRIDVSLPYLLQSSTSASRTAVDCLHINISATFTIWTDNKMYIQRGIRPCANNAFLYDWLIEDL